MNDCWQHDRQQEQGRLAGTTPEPRAGAPPACRRLKTGRSIGVEGGHVVAQWEVGVDRDCTGPRPKTYRLALFRFAQAALTFFDMAFRAAALHGRRFRLALDRAGLVVG